MLERKNIDRVFQENLKDLEIYPNKRVWNNIEGSLHGKTTKSSVALWKKLGGIAAMLAAIITSGLFYFNNDTNSQITTPVSSTESKTEKIQFETPLTPVFVQPKAELAENKDEIKIDRKSGKTIFIKQPNNKVIVTDNEIASIYSTIEDKYVVDKNVLMEGMDDMEDMNETQSIAARINEIPATTKEIDPIDKKWSVGPTVAPVFYNSLQNGSPLNDALSENTKSSDNALSIGVRVNYQVSNKFFIQSGVNKVELAYNTKNVNALISSSKNSFNNINTDKSGVILTPASNLSNSGSQNELNKSSVNGDLNQSIEYFELPIEMKYNLYDKKVGLNLVGGFSTLILSNNSVSMVTQNDVTDLGDANNLNDLNFSGNLGVDLDYKISKSWYLNVAPMFKYQFNTYSGNSGNFRPYYFGLYSGLNYKF
ncbi:hypothetical protein [Lutimonas sp.]|uniref:hypothetical protein n=1 Tax=Lutimonas sp. TaxID=1872403 RepID=UPI003D9BFD9A